MSESLASTTPFAAGTLSNIAYTDEANDGSDRQKRDIISNLANTTIGAQGPWSLIWGPATNGGNLVYVAENSARNRYAVAIRGTVTSSSWAMFDNIAEDADVFSQDHWRYPHSTRGLKIAAGFNTALENIIAMTDPVTDWSLLDFLRKTLNASNKDVVVTGHSLGGALATVVSMWLGDQLSKGGGPSLFRLTPYTFAAPTAGNQAFADAYDAFFPTSRRYVNELDIVPMGYDALATLANMYPSPGPSLRDYCWLGYEALEFFAPTFKKMYAQTNRRSGTVKFRGPAASASNTFPQQADIEHSVGVYLAHLAIPEPEAAGGAAG